MLHDTEYLCQRGTPARQRRRVQFIFKSVLKQGSRIMPYYASDAIGIEDIITYRHWNAESEHFTGGDSLATALYLGWTMPETVEMSAYWYAGTRRVAVYHITLERGEEHVTMPVIGNPFIERLLSERHCRVVALGERQPVEAETRVLAPAS
jgi:hypothetical protein